MNGVLEVPGLVFPKLLLTRYLPSRSRTRHATVPTGLLIVVVCHISYHCCVLPNSTMQAKGAAGQKIYYEVACVVRQSTHAAGLTAGREHLYRVAFTRMRVPGVDIKVHEPPSCRTQRACLFLLYRTSFRLQPYFAAGICRRRPRVFCWCIRFYCTSNAVCATEPP